jgi:2-polyprenyl-6-methoxyphenol hydroxylase-like FAD-dependent oxidoreductase
MKQQSILISGAGIAGPALAYWLVKDGHTVTLVERTPEFRAGGYVIDFWGLGYELVEKMGLLPEVIKAGYEVKELRLVNKQGRKIAGLNADVFRTATFGRYTSLPRGDLARVIYTAVAPKIETRFGDSIKTISEDTDGVAVTFEHGAPQRFDMVIGADGLHSKVRELMFGPESDFEKFLGYTVAAFDTDGYEPRTEDTYVSYGVPGKQAARFAMRDNRTTFLFVLAGEDGRDIDPHDTDAHKAFMHKAFGSLGWECPQILEAMDRVPELYFDRVSQIRMPTWHTNRTALVGDAGYCPSLLAGQGSALAIIGGYVLAGEIARASTPSEAFARYEEILHSFMLHKQVAAEGFAPSFAPKTAFGLFFRNISTRLLNIPFFAKQALGSSLLDKIKLPEYTFGENETPETENI